MKHLRACMRHTAPPTVLKRVRKAVDAVSATRVWFQKKGLDVRRFVTTGGFPAGFSGKGRGNSTRRRDFRCGS